MHPEVSRQHGSMLISVLFIMLILSGLMATMVTLSGQSSRQLVYETLALRARLAAEAVLEQQIFATLDNIDADMVVTSSAPAIINQCQAHVQDLQKPSGGAATQVKIITTGNCSGSGLTVVRNIEVEVIE
ncbi:hypothetical protein Q9290_05660 [Oceanimonas sp. CHS3-5]|uniref:hypothetical protein n=1 Tax=Oceanimonas sp. CHS3-5 TaxID=3068186 RepID=UPI00273DE752|nr:hypothetical protein [Oceanimonas sp. CHS3-5]MDP5291774.1 hypothetical protein [Oceanimonas sp. CHS3-5]